MPSKPEATKHRRRAKSAALQISQIPAIDALIARNEVVVRIAQRVRGANDDERQARNRVSKRITYARNIGLIAEVSPRIYRFGEIARWAKSEWPGLFQDWPAHIDATAHSAISATTYAEAEILPGTLARCYALIQELHGQVTTLQSELASARDEIDRLRPDAEAWLKIRLKNKQNASKPRK